MHPTTNTLYYHSHITHNLTHIDQRTHKYIKHRKEFLKQYCSPIEEKILKLDKEIQFYRHLIENQNEMIENQVEVLRLKGEIGEFKDSQGYFLARIEEYQKRILELNVENDVIEKQITKHKSALTKLTLQKSHQIYNNLHTQRLNDAKSMSSSKHSRSIIKSSVASKTLGNSRLHVNEHKGDGLLPAIFKVEKYYGSKQSKEVGEKNIVMQNTEKEQLMKEIAQKSQINHPASVSQSRARLHRKQQQLKQKFKQEISSFNKFEILFKQCFEKKKSQIQKSVSQLQSKLISDRQKFLQICEAIGQRNLKKITFDQFQTLTGDQLMTLFISFPWIQKKIFKELNLRRKLIVQLQKSKFF